MATLTGEPLPHCWHCGASGQRRPRYSMPEPHRTLREVEAFIEATIDPMRAEGETDLRSVKHRLVNHRYNGTYNTEDITDGQ